MAKAYINRQPDYQDLDLDFIAHPTTGDLYKKTGEDAIKRSVRNLIFTNHYERPFQSYIGSGIRKSLFDNMTEFSAMTIKEHVTNVINNFEPRVKLLEVSVEPDFDRNGYTVQLMYVILNREQPVITSLFLERVR